MICFWDSGLSCEIINLYWRNLFDFALCEFLCVGGCTGEVQDRTGCASFACSICLERWNSAPGKTPPVYFYSHLFRSSGGLSIVGAYKWIILIFAGFVSVWMSMHYLDNGTKFITAPFMLAFNRPSFRLYRAYVYSTWTFYDKHLPTSLFRIRF